MPAEQKQCEQCPKKFWATRKDALYCSARCKRRAYRESCRFQFPVVPQSGVEGIHFNRLSKKWRVQIKRKYVAEFAELEEAKKRLLVDL